MKRAWFRRYWWQLLISGAGLWAGIILVNEKNWLGISALATLVLALIASWSILENRRIRLEDRELNFKAQSLEEVRKWAWNCTELIFSYDLFADSAARYQFTKRLQSVAIARIHIVNEAAKFGDDLLLPVEKAFKELNNYIRALSTTNATAYTHEMEELDNCLKDALKVILKIKDNLKL